MISKEEARALKLKTNDETEEFYVFVSTNEDKKTLEQWETKADDEAQ